MCWKPRRKKIISENLLSDVVFGPQSLHKIHDLIKNKSVQKKKLLIQA